VNMRCPLHPLAPLHTEVSFPFPSEKRNELSSIHNQTEINMDTDTQKNSAFHLNFFGPRLSNPDCTIMVKSEFPTPHPCAEVLPSYSSSYGGTLLVWTLFMSQHIGPGSLLEELGM